jgi:hypothetical protein
MKVLCFDPSGNFKEGNGHTGWAYFVGGKLITFGEVKASDFTTVEGYWHGIISDILEEIVHSPDVIVCENYQLFENKAKSQSWSHLETPQLIGYLRMWAWHERIRWVEQRPSDKVRVADPILVRMGVLEQKGSRYRCMGKSTNLHMRDAIRHGIFFHRFTAKKLEDGKL